MSEIPHQIGVPTLEQRFAALVLLSELHGNRIAALESKFLVMKRPKRENNLPTKIRVESESGEIIAEAKVGADGISEPIHAEFKDMKLVYVTHIFERNPIE